MYSFLLKKALPFALTFLFGAALSGLVGLFGGSEQKKFEWTSSTSTYDFGSRCRMRRHNLVAESKPLTILFKPDARLPHGLGGYGRGGLLSPTSALVRVTFGADGRVQEVEPFYEDSYGLRRLPLTSSDIKNAEAWENVKQAARLIQFTPETRDGVPATVTKELEIFFFGE